MSIFNSKKKEDDEMFIASYYANLERLRKLESENKELRKQRQRMSEIIIELVKKDKEND